MNPKAVAYRAGKASITALLSGKLNILEYPDQEMREMSVRQGNINLLVEIDSISYSTHQVGADLDRFLGS